jgi:hypothetical protein
MLHVHDHVIGLAEPLQLYGEPPWLQCESSLEGEPLLLYGESSPQLRVSLHSSRVSLSPHGSRVIRGASDEIPHSNNWMTSVQHNRDNV